jgi:DNA-binding HxlR family transcriptional regulator
MVYRERLNSLYSELNQHLSGIQLQFHQQQLQYFQQVIQLLMPQISVCKLHTAQLSELDTLTSSLVDTTQIHELLNRFHQFLSSPIEDDCRPLLIELHDQIGHYIDLVSRQTAPETLHFQDFSDLNSELAYRQVIDPISNLKRLEILLAIRHGRKRFKELEDQLDLQAGHLIYHLNPLKSAQYVIQDEKKNYILTEKGLSILAAITKIQSLKT